MNNCQHEWTPMFTDRNSPQSFRNGSYRGFRVVGRRCVKCDAKDMDAVEILDQIWEMVGADETDYQSHEIVERVYELLRDRYENDT